MNAALNMFLALVAAGATTHRSRTPEELEALRLKCTNAELLELGHIAFYTTDDEGRRIVLDEINRRLGER